MIAGVFNHIISESNTRLGSENNFNNKKIKTDGGLFVE
jgi:hypothetical protein